MSTSLAFTIKGGFNKYLKHLNKIEKTIIPEATVTALNKTGTRIKTQVVRGISTNTGIKQKLIRQRTKIFKANRRKKEIKAWFGSYAISYSSFLTKSGSVKVTKSGIKIGKFNFLGAFKATLKNGHTDYYQRKGKRRLPIKKAAAEIQPAAKAVMNHIRVSFAHQEFKKQYQYELKRRLRNAGY